jgi:Rps23 Pro-64 3,4-dihydroxylase Tpa1-like proline 4-hydroxylase
MKEKLEQLVCESLEKNFEKLQLEFYQSIRDVGIRYFALDNLLPIAIAEEIHNAFPSIKKMRLMNSIREKKYTSKNLEKFNTKIADITLAFQDPKVLSVIEKITGIENQIPDSKLYAGGLSAMSRGHFLGPHIDNSHDGDRKNYRTLNLLYYVTPEWDLSFGGNLELWDASHGIL